MPSLARGQLDHAAMLSRPKPTSTQVEAILYTTVAITNPSALHHKLIMRHAAVDSEVHIAHAAIDS